MFDLRSQFWPQVVRSAFQVLRGTIQAHAIITKKGKPELPNIPTKKVSRLPYIPIITKKVADRQTFEELLNVNSQFFILSGPCRVGKTSGANPLSS